MFEALKQTFKEYAEFERFFSDENKEFRTLVFYAESAIYYHYYRDYIEYILANSDRKFSYISSSPSDRILGHENPQMRAFYIKNLLSATMSKLDAKVLIMTAPDLNRGYIKRAPGNVHHVYAFHGIGSTHQQYRAHAFDHYNSLLCVGEYQTEEIRAAEKLYKTSPKKLILTGYPLLERIYREHKALPATPPDRESGKLCVIAPTWTPLQTNSSILETCIEPLIKALSRTELQVLLRPHPEFSKRKPGVIKSLEKLLKNSGKAKLQSDVSSMQVIHEADILITDHSSIGIDYCLGTERPVLWIDTETRCDNPERDLIGIEPVESKYRSELGARLRPEAIDTAGDVIAELMRKQEDYARAVPDIRGHWVSNWLNAAKTGSEHILSLL